MAPMRKCSWSTALQSPKDRTSTQENIQISKNSKLPNFSLNWNVIIDRDELITWTVMLSQLMTSWTDKLCRMWTVPTFHNWTTIWHVLLCNQLLLASPMRSSLESFFLSSPMRLVQSQAPLPLPSAFLFSHIEKDTPQLFIASISFWTCSDFFYWSFFGRGRALLVIPLHCIFN